MYSTEILLNTATIRKVNLTKIDSNSTARETQIKRHYSAKLQTSKQTLTTSKQLSLPTVTFFAILKRAEINLRRLIVDGCVKKAKD